MNVADDVCEDGENNSADELATSGKPHKGCAVARILAKWVTATRTGKLWDWTRAKLSHCLDLHGVKLPSGSNR